MNPRDLSALRLIDILFYLHIYSNYFYIISEHWGFFILVEARVEALHAQCEQKLADGCVLCANLFFAKICKKVMRWCGLRNILMLDLHSVDKEKKEEKPKKYNCSSFVHCETV